MSNYSEQYKHPKWQKKRNEILLRDNYTCKWCDNKEKQLHVHHKFYLKGKDIWDYPDHFYETLCSTCHGQAHVLLEEMYKTLSLLPRGAFKFFMDSNLNVMILEQYKIAWADLNKVTGDE